MNGISQIDAEIDRAPVAIVGLHDHGPFDRRMARISCGVEIDFAIGLVIPPFAVLIERVRRVVDEEAPAGTVRGVRTCDVGIERQGRAVAGGDVSIDHRPPNDLEVDRCAAPIDGGQAARGKLIGSGLRRDRGIAAIARSEVRPATQRQALAVSKELIEAIGKRRLR